MANPQPAAVASSGRLTFELVSPERLVLSRPVDMVVCPGTEGLFGVLPGHAPLIATLKYGVIDVYEGGKITDRLFIAGGFAEVTPERCVVLAERVAALADLDRGALAAKLPALEAAAGPAAQLAPSHAEETAPSELTLTRAMLAALDGKPF